MIRKQIGKAGMSRSHNKPIHVFTQLLPHNVYSAESTSIPTIVQQSPLSGEQITNITIETQLELH